MIFSPDQSTIMVLFDQCKYQNLIILILTFLFTVDIRTLITYPDLGHLFYPSSQWITVAGGPMEPKVLEDLFDWLSDPVRDIKKFTILRQE